jgi:quinol-cytochrome oxidoreductase complex cytochrome b subunit
VAPVALRFFYVVGPLFAVWAVVLSVVGFRRPDLPRRIGGERIAIGITLALMLMVVLSATIGAKWEHSEQAKAGPEAHGKSGGPTP